MGRCIRASVTLALATSPASCPPMPSATAHRPRSVRTRTASSLTFRLRPTSVRLTHSYGKQSPPFVRLSIRLAIKQGSCDFLFATLRPGGISRTMNKEAKAYSNKALPSGTVLREWRLEEVLGVGGFGIVYKARGIYFNELVAIKEYFPSSISERDSDDTVVPIDSDAEEVHALGLKKFVEEAKLLWNLSTPSRHPNIVSVRSLFEIHGTAYMVMDFEDGVSLSKLLKQGRRFNERSLWNIVRPIAEGLDRAHRVGVLHRDIKPPNILINEDGRPVLIDFGSARFEAAEATSTKVTFHTPPYAALEQYVKTYEQGPWTDIYALGVVMSECVTGEKPPEVLERLHAGLAKPLGEGKWPGYSKRFLTGVDAGMVVKPEERPQSISDWLAMFGKSSD